MLLFSILVFLSCLKKIVFMVDYLKNADVKLFLLIFLKDILWIIPESYVLDLDTSKFFTALHIRVLPLSCVKEHFNKQLQNCQCLRVALVGSVYCTTQCPMDSLLKFHSLLESEKFLGL